MTTALVIGLGSIGRRHGRNLRALGIDRLVGFDPDADRRDRFCAETGGTTVADSAEGLAMLPDLAVIASPNRFHVAQARACAETGCHLLVEKPLGTAMDGVDALIATVEHRGLFAHFGSNWKFHPAFRAMKEAVTGGALGHPVAAQVLAGQWLPDWHPWEDYRNMYAARADLGGGAVLDTHELDYLIWMLGPVRRLSGICRNSGCLDITTEDIAAAWLEFANGALVTLHADYLQRVPSRRWHLSGDAGTLEWDVRDGRVLLSRPGVEPITLYEGQPDPNDMYLAQTRHVLDGVAGRVAPVTPLSHARTVLALQLAWRQEGAA